MDLLGPVQDLVTLLLGVGALVLTGFAFIDAVQRPAAAFSYADKRTKTFWMIVVGIAFALAFVTLGRNTLSIFGIISVVAGAVYLVDVRPKVRQYRGGRGSGGSRGW
jgi:uncharacterized membrane protein